jgi:nicotinamidase-related amidase/MFS family permease
VSAAPESARDAFSWRFTTPLYMGSALNPVNSSLIATALVPIAAAVHVPAGRIAVLVSALYLASSIAQPTAGKLAEVFGPRRVFLTGILIVLIGGIVGGAGQNLPTLIVSRVLIGIGTSAGYPSAMLLIRRRAEWAGLDKPPGGVLGGLQIAGTATAALGLPLGGLLVAAWGWRTTFLINVPVALVALALAAFWIPADPPAGEQRRIREVASRIDVAGIIGFGGAMTALLVFLMSLPRPVWPALGLAAVVGSALVWWELRADHPFIDVRLLASNLALTRTYLRFALITLCIYTVLYGITQWLEAGRGLSAEGAGLLLLPMTGAGPDLAAQPGARAAYRGRGVRARRLGGRAFPHRAQPHRTDHRHHRDLRDHPRDRSQRQSDRPVPASERQPGRNGLGSVPHLRLRRLHRVLRDHQHRLPCQRHRSRPAHHRDCDDRRERPGADHYSRRPPAPDPGPASGRYSQRAARPGQPGRRPSPGEHMTDTPIDPRRTALLLMDYQSGILSRLGDAADLLERAAQAIAVVRGRGGQIGYVRVAFEDADYEAIPAHSHFAPLLAAAGPAMHADSPATAVHARIAPEPGDIVVRKTRVGAFSTTDLDDQLRSRGITTLILAGLSTSGVLLSTVRDASDRDYRVLVLADASADPQPGVHEFLTERIFPRQAQVITTGDLETVLPVP